MDLSEAAQVSQVAYTNLQSSQSVIPRLDPFICELLDRAQFKPKALPPIRYE